MTSGDSRQWSSCHCVCHRSKHVRHCVPCCSTCSYCFAHVHSLKAHVKDCHPEQFKRDGWVERRA